MMEWHEENIIFRAGMKPAPSSIIKKACLWLKIQASIQKSKKN